MSILKTILCLIVTVSTAMAATEIMRPMPLTNPSDRGEFDRQLSQESASPTNIIQEMEPNAENTDRDKLIISVTDSNNVKTRFLVDKAAAFHYSSMLGTVVSDSADLNEEIPLEADPRIFATLLTLLEEYHQNKADYDGGTKKLTLTPGDVPGLVNLANFLFRGGNTVNITAKDQSAFATPSDVGFFQALLKAATPVLFDPKILDASTTATVTSSAAAPVKLGVPYEVYKECILYATPSQLYRFLKGLKELDTHEIDQEGELKDFKEYLDKQFINFKDIKGDEVFSESTHIIVTKAELIEDRTTLEDLSAEIEENRIKHQKDMDDYYQRREDSYNDETGFDETIVEPVEIIIDPLTVIGKIFETHPEATLIVDFGADTAIDDNFGTPIIRQGYSSTPNDGAVIPNSVKKLSFLGDHITKIGNNFLDYCVKLKELDLPSLLNVTEVGDDFLAQCKGLKTIDQSFLSQLTKIGNSFLFDCEGLETIDLSFLSVFTEIGDKFLCMCSGLKTIDLRPLSNVTKIGEMFLGNCSGLETVDLSSLLNVTKIGKGFLHACEGLKTIDLRPLSNVIKIEDYFLARCGALETVDLRPLSKITQIGNAFLESCGLETVNLPSLLNITKIGNSFFSNCSNLKTIDLSSLLNVTEIGYEFFWNCTELKEIFITPGSITEQTIRASCPDIVLLLKNSV